MTEIRDEYLGLVKGLKSQLDAELLAGITEIPVLKPKKKKGELKQATSEAETKSPAGKDKGKLELMKQLYARVSGCAKCDLHKDRTNLVFGIGNVQARLCFVGEAPGRDEDKQGKPFVGRAGKLLTDIIKAMGLERKDVFIANILKCRPPGNRNPETKEISVCWPYLEEQLKIIQPKVICTLGKIAGMTLLETETPIGQLRGKFSQWQGIKVMPTYHPAYLLRNPHAKKIVWEDMKQIMGVLGL
ncbi:MAG: uracil-DNA glycosylase [Candidatus Omnitrophica bacterium]|nr:uracil-DNA glycosylase [Candidatus Omnitrophota bacterium]